MTSVEEIVDAVKALRPEEQFEIRRRLQTLLDEADVVTLADNASGEEAIALDQRVQRALFEAGLLSEIKPPITDPTPYRREPITIKGKPLSETVIEERR
jgi:hypothetical protein